jgi:hypothetical protein
MIIHREIGPSYHHKAIVHGVNYSSLMVESKEETLVKEERWSEAISAVVPPQSSYGDWQQPLFHVFMFLRCLLLGTPRGALNSRF